MKTKEEFIKRNLILFVFIHTPVIWVLLYLFLYVMLWNENEFYLKKIIYIYINIKVFNEKFYHFIYVF